MGCISKDLSRGALYFDSNKANAATVSVKLVKGTTFGSGLDVTMIDPLVPGLDYLGFVRGSENSDVNLKSQSANYVTPTLVEKTPPGSPPLYVENFYSQSAGVEKGSESALWSFNSIFNEIYPRWVNEDGSVPFYGYYLQSYPTGLLSIVGDVNKFKSVYPGAIPIGFTLVPLDDEE